MLPIHEPGESIDHCFMTPSTQGMIMSRALGGTRVTQYACACDETKGLPGLGDPHTHVLVTDVRLVSCTECKKTQAFKDAYLSQMRRPYEEPAPTVPAPQPEESTTPPPSDGE